MVLPRTVKFLGKQCFLGSLVEVVGFEPGSKLQRIESWCLCNCEFLLNITLPRALQFIAGDAFDWRCLFSLTPPGLAPHFDAWNSSRRSIGKNCNVLPPSRNFGTHPPQKAPSGSSGSHETRRTGRVRRPQSCFAEEKYRSHDHGSY
jgi:hypothetical protein